MGETQRLSITLFDHRSRLEGHFHCELGGSLEGMHLEGDVVGDSPGGAVHQRLGEDSPGVEDRAAGIPVAEDLPAVGSLGLAAVGGHAAGGTLGVVGAHQVPVVAAGIGLVAEGLLETATSHRAEAEDTALVVVPVLLAVVAVVPLSGAARYPRWNLGFVAMGTVVVGAAGASVHSLEPVVGREARHLKVVH